MAGNNEAPDRAAAEAALLELVGTGEAIRHPLGDDAVWQSATARRGDGLRHAPRGRHELTTARATFDLSALGLPIVQAPMAGGPSTPELAIAVCRAGGLGFLAAGYKRADAVGEEIRAVRAATRRAVRGQPVRAERRARRPRRTARVPAPDRPRGRAPGRRARRAPVRRRRLGGQARAGLPPSGPRWCRSHSAARRRRCSSACMAPTSAAWVTITNVGRGACGPCRRRGRADRPGNRGRRASRAGSSTTGRTRAAIGLLALLRVTANAHAAADDRHRRDHGRRGAGRRAVRRRERGPDRHRADALARGGDGRGPARPARRARRRRA